MLHLKSGFSWQYGTHRRWLFRTWSALVSAESHGVSFWHAEPAWVKGVDLNDPSAFIFSIDSSILFSNNPRQR
jgi:hypothetical protein